MVIDRAHVEENQKDIVSAILNGSIFVYPTDTIYGIGCNALNRDAITKIRQLKRREIKPFSIIAPNQEWIEHHCVVNDEVSLHLDKLPGPYTLFLKLRHDHKIPDEINPSCDGTIGIRMPKHWFAEIIERAGVPFITTSVNVSGMPYMTILETLDETIRNNVDFIIYEGENNGRESIKIDLTR